MTQTLAVTWVSNRLFATTTRYREVGGGWTTVTAFRSRAFPQKAGKYLHTALLEGLSDDTVYEVNPVGSDTTDTVKTARTTGVKIAAVSDYHSGASAVELMGAKITANEVDLVVMVGDLVDDNGVVNTTSATRWLTFVNDMTTHFRTTDGAQVPMLAVIGNHDAAAPDANGAGAYVGGTGTLGIMGDVFSTGYAAEHPTRFAAGIVSVPVGDVFVVTLDTDHVTSLALERDWFAGQLAANAANYAHIEVFGHVPAFPTWSGGFYNTPSQVRELRNHFWTEMQKYSNARHYVCGHLHAMQISPPIEMSLDPELSDADNDLRFVTGNGPRQVGAGPWGGARLEMTQISGPLVTSTIDGQSYIEAMLHYVDDTAYGVIGNITNPINEIWHGWLLEFGSTTVTATARSRAAGHGDFYQVVDAV